LELRQLPRLPVVNGFVDRPQQPHRALLICLGPRRGSSEPATTRAQRMAGLETSLDGGVPEHERPTFVE
ncbi:hypothetical protein ACFWAX_37000, partial [Streptomyces sp. NPDC059956]|uniref:hypothetical protein n=1 Tax=Streptomyces sp. NPDC059956 TaxID=3347015 RepID=UPI00365A5CFD